jgi:hypothetical protein
MERRVVVLVECGFGAAIRRALESLSDVGLPARQPYISSLTSSVWCVRLMNIGMALDRLVR